MKKKKPPENHFSKVAVETLGKFGTDVVFAQALAALSSALYVICGTETEAAELQKRASTEKLKEHWRGRRDAARSIRRHCDSLEPAIRALYKLVPAETPREIGGREDLEKKLKQAKALERSE
jgi:SpoVK/Ycf46/Vps4 family AAA+-type ATPase